MGLGRGDGGSNYNAWVISTFTAVSRPVGFWEALPPEQPQGWERGAEQRGQLLCSSPTHFNKNSFASDFY